ALASLPWRKSSKAFLSFSVWGTPAVVSVASGPGCWARAERGGQEQARRNKRATVDLRCRIRGSLVGPEGDQKMSLTIGGFLEVLTGGGVVLAGGGVVGAAVAGGSAGGVAGGVAVATGGCVGAGDAVAGSAGVFSVLLTECAGWDGAST